VFIAYAKLTATYLDVLDGCQGIAMWLLEDC